MISAGRGHREGSCAAGRVGAPQAIRTPEGKAISSANLMRMTRRRADRSVGVSVSVSIENHLLSAKKKSGSPRPYSSPPQVKGHLRGKDNRVRVVNLNRMMYGKMAAFVHFSAEISLSSRAYGFSLFFPRYGPVRPVCLLFRKAEKK